MRWFIWAFAAFFYFYEYLLRVSPSTMVPELMQAFNLNAAQIGVLGSSFFFAYAPMQIPVGVLMDRFGARKLLTYASIGCGAGSLIFGLAKILPLAYLSRILIGTGASFAFVAMVYVCSHWFEANKRALLVGLANSIAMLGGLAGEGPLSSAVDKFGWRLSMIFLGFVGFGGALLIFFTLRAKSNSNENLEKHLKNQKDSPKLFEGIRIMASSGQSWLNSIIALLAYMPTSALTGLWGIAFIQTSHGVSKVTAGYAVSMLFIGWMIGGPVMGAISDRFGRKSIINISILLAFITLAPVIFWTKLPIEWIYALFLILGFLSGGQLLNFTYATEINPPHVKGAAVACTNFIVAVGSAAIFPVIGGLLDLKTKAHLGPNQSRVYSASDYQFALSSLLVCLAAAWVLSFFLNEKLRKR